MTEDATPGPADHDRRPTPPPRSRGSILSHPAFRRSRAKTWIERALDASRMLVLVPVVVLAAASLAAFAYGTDVFVRLVRDVIVHPRLVADNVALFLMVIDLFLVGATMLIAGIGFYELFISRIGPGGALQMPPWLQMRDLNDLKARVVGMIVLVAAVNFIEVLVNFASASEVLEIGGGVAMVIAALTVFVRFGASRGGD